jgi:hypothetical protein
MPLLLWSSEFAGYFLSPLLSSLKKQNAQHDAYMSTKKEPKAQPKRIHSPASYDPRYQRRFIISVPIAPKKDRA